MKSIIVASAFILAASTAAVPFTKKPSGHTIPTEFTVKRPMVPGGAPKPPFEPFVAPPRKPEAPMKLDGEAASKKHQSHRRALVVGDDNSGVGQTQEAAAANNKKPMHKEPMHKEPMHKDTMHKDTMPKMTMPKEPMHKDTMPKMTMPKEPMHKDTMPKMAMPKETPTVDLAIYKGHLFGDDMHSTDHSHDNVANVDGELTVAPKVRRDAPTDTDILQYALTLEHLEKAFYDGALKKFNAKAFAKAGFPSLVRERFEQIATHEADHVTLLTNAIGANANAACNYTFPYDDPRSFAALSMVLEGVGVTAYLGAAQFIESKEYLTVAGSILTTESRHAAWVASTANKVSPWSGSFDTPLDLDQVYSLAAQFITGCPSTNVALPVQPFPTLSVENKNYGPGDPVTLHFDGGSAKGEPTYLVIYSGLDTFYAPIENNKALLPADLEGTSYGLVSTSNSAVTDSNTVAGMVVFEFYNDSYHY
ncbi:hypothetical protein FRB97_006224 [Tulasnella sp. 331]|nr:hypothetical protein FRB97_006224 [Tulasnella sp. 331]